MTVPNIADPSPEGAIDHSATLDDSSLDLDDGEKTTIGSPELGEGSRDTINLEDQVPVPTSDTYPGTENLRQHW